MEIPTKILSDTWFGPNTQMGTLCYASKTYTRSSRQEVTPRPHRAVTPVTVRNQSEELLSIDKLSIPVPHLALYGRDDRSEEHTSELQSRGHLVCRLLLEKKKNTKNTKYRLHRH